MYMARAQHLPSAETGWIEEAPSNEEAIEYVTMKQVERGHWSNEAKEYYYAKRAAALGVREPGQIKSKTIVVNAQCSISSKNTQNALGCIVTQSQDGRKTVRKSCLTQS